MSLTKTKVASAINRCPFCHEDVNADEATVCQGCLARHHEGCWREAGHECASCGSGRPLAPAALPPLTTPVAVETLRERGYSAREIQAFLASVAPPAPRARRSAWPKVVFLLGAFLLAAMVMGEHLFRAQQNLKRDMQRLVQVQEQLDDAEARYALLNQEYNQLHRDYERARENGLPQEEVARLLEIAKEAGAVRDSFYGSRLSDLREEVRDLERSTRRSVLDSF